MSILKNELNSNYDIASLKNENDLFLKIPQILPFLFLKIFAQQYSSIKNNSNGINTFYNQFIIGPIIRENIPELITKNYLPRLKKNEPKYKSIIKEIWEWKDFPYRENIGDTGIDLVALTYDNEFWAIQCKFYDETREISKSDVDTFLATSSKMFDVEGCLTKYSYRLIVSTTVKYSTNAEDALQNQDPPVGRIGIDDFSKSLLFGMEQKKE